jgi:hypothetical protein
VRHAIELFIQEVVPVASLLTTMFFGVLAFVQARTRRSIIYRLSRRHSLKGVKYDIPPGLLRLARSVANPHLLVVAIRITGAKDIRAEDFGDRRPLVLGLGARLVSVVRVAAGESPQPRTRMAGQCLEIYPTLLRSRQRLLFCVLVDGPKPAISCELSPLADVHLRPARVGDPGPIARKVPLAGILGGVLLLLSYPDGNIPGWLVVGAYSAAGCVWAMVIIAAWKVIGMLREYREAERFLGFLAANAAPSSQVSADLGR